MSIPGLLSENITFEDPIRNESFVHHVSALDLLSPKEYTVGITPFNNLGFGNMFSEEVFVPGEAIALPPVYFHSKSVSSPSLTH